MNRIALIKVKCDYDEAQQRLLKAGSVDKARSDKTTR